MPFPNRDGYTITRWQRRIGAQKVFCVALDASWSRLEDGQQDMALADLWCGSRVARQLTFESYQRNTLQPLATSQEMPTASDEHALNNLAQDSSKAIEQLFTRLRTAPTLVDPVLQQLELQAYLQVENRRLTAAQRLNAQQINAESQSPRIRSDTGSTSPVSVTQRNGKRRRDLPPRAKAVLQSWFDSHMDHPYPSTCDKRKLANAANIDVRQVTNWFSNTRARKGR